MTPTRIRTLVGIALICAAAGWGLTTILASAAGRVVPVPWLAAATLWILTVALGLWTVLSRPRLRRTPGARPMPPLVAARTAALAMAASRVGALVGGFYAGVAIGVLPMREVPAGAGALWPALVAALGGIVLAAIALWLERMCRLPVDGPGGTPGAGSTGPAGAPGRAARSAAAPGDPDRATRVRS